MSEYLKYFLINQSELRKFPSRNQSDPMIFRMSVPIREGLFVDCAYYPTFPYTHPAVRRTDGGPVVLVRYSEIL